MKLIKNSGNDRVLDALKPLLTSGSSFGIASPEFSLFGFAQLRELLEQQIKCRLVLLDVNKSEFAINGSESDRSERNKLNGRWLAQLCLHWLNQSAELREAPGPLPQTTIVVRHPTGQAHAFWGSCPLTTGRPGTLARKPV